MLPFQGFHSVHQPPTILHPQHSTQPSTTHKEAERRRRQRINNHLSTLRSLLPNTTKTDKASLLAEVVQRVKDLKARAADAVEFAPFPGESDEAKLSSFFSGGEGEARKVKVSMCCQERPGLNRELSHAIRSVRARTVRAEMMTVGGRTRTVVVVEWADGCGGEEEVEVLRSSLKGIVEKKGSECGLDRMVGQRKRGRVCGLV